ncbi:CocE/NonD family hydrolase [Streptomyces fradiae]|uniref:CocE/NonD family hydrolase n=1 Tax=Streptomyces fradiae TaxID=1906 RepID=UPI0033C1DB43
MSRITPTAPLRPHRSRIAATALTAAIVMGTGIGLAPVTQAVEAPTAATASQTLPTTTRFVDIAGYEGVTLAANVVAPTDTSRDYPVIVLPTSWAMPQIEYIAQATKLAEKGYVVVSYNVRGFWQSEGEIEVAGPKDVADARKVIDWALANTAADPELIGMAGVSYGAGISLLTAAQDARVDAVSAMSGWADLVESLYKGETQHTQATAILASLGYATGRPSAEAAEKMEIMLSGKTDRIDEVIPWAEQRSVVHQVDRLNTNDTAIMLANAWGDSFFAPNQAAGPGCGPSRSRTSRCPRSPATPDSSEPTSHSAAAQPRSGWNVISSTSSSPPPTRRSGAWRWTTSPATTPTPHARCPRRSGVP